MENLTYVTGNYGKYISVKEKFQKENLDISFVKFDLDEPNVNDIYYISKIKALEAYEVLQRPLFVIDSGFYIQNYPNYPNYPGAFVKRSGVSQDIDTLLKTMEKVDNRYCYFLDCLTFYDGNNFYQFTGKSEGTLTRNKRGDYIKKAKSNLWYVFKPKNCSKTLSEMTDEERENRLDDRTSATEEFLAWYKEYLKNPKLQRNRKDK